MNQDNAGTPNPIAPEGVSTTNETVTTAETTVGTVTPTPTITQPLVQPKKPKGLIATIIILAILALAGLAFGIYGMFLKPAPKCETKISSLQNEISEKEAKIAELETTISNLETESKETSEIDEQTQSIEETENTTEPATNPTASATTSSEAPTIELLSEIADTDTTKVYKIGECTADGGTGASSHFSLKCHVTVNGKDALVSYHDGDNNILRLSLSK